MNYGYDPTPFDDELAEALEKIIATMPEDERGMRPYVEVGGLYPGVRVRRLTHYSDTVLEDTVKRMDTTYAALCKEHDYDPKADPTPWCSNCGATAEATCGCGPIADNE